MNNLFVKLAYEAKLFNGQQAPFKEVEKFAELIVKECANIAFNEYAATNGADSGESAILKHFGVEE